jgi:hypothetical protein
LFPSLSEKRFFGDDFYRVCRPAPCKPAIILLLPNKRLVMRLQRPRNLYMPLA